MMGKYLNGYAQTAGHVADGAATDVPASYVPPGWNEWDCRGLGLPRVQLHAERERRAAALRASARRLPDGRARPQGGRVHRRRSPESPAVLPRAGHVRAALPVHPRTGRSPRFRRPARAEASQLRRPSHPPATVARPAPAADPQRAGPDRLGVPPPGASGAGRRSDDRGDRAGAQRRRAGREHLPRVQLRQRPAHRRVPADARQADRVRHRHTGAPRGHRSGGPA